MEMVLMGICFAVLGTAVCAMAFGAATRPEETAPTMPPIQPAQTVAPARFFGNQPSLPLAVQPQVPIEALLLQIENHVRLEQAAAESFVEFPTTALLHSKTISPLVN